MRLPAVGFRFDCPNAGLLSGSPHIVPMNDEPISADRTAGPDQRHALTSAVKSEAQRLGFELVGISDIEPPPHETSFAEWLRRSFHGTMAYMERTEALRRDPQQMMPWTRSVVSVGMNYFTPHPRPKPAAEAKGWISRYAWGDDYHEIVKNRLELLLAFIRRQTHEPVEGRAFVDSGPILERDYAGVAGIGWIGKNTQLISPRRGSWFFLGELFMSVPLIADRPIRNRCGRCELCLDACPTGAFVGPYILDARRCISYLTIELKGFIPRHLRPLLGNHIFGCDICQEVCPYNVKSEPTSEPAYAPGTGLYAPDLIPLLAMTDEEFRRRFRASPIARAKRRGFLRNVAVALGNLKSGEAVPALIHSLSDHEPLVRGHAAWALGQIGTAQAAAALRERRQAESDPEVVAEIDAGLAAVSNTRLTGEAAAR